LDHQNNPLRSLTRDTVTTQFTLMQEEMFPLLESEASRRASQCGGRYDQPVEDAIGHSRIADLFVPAGHRFD
jgi:hypothetical protein